MPLQKQIIPIPFTGGVDTKSDPKQVGPARVVTLENGTFISPGRIKKRNSFAALNNTIMGGGSISVGQAIAAYNNELVLADKTTLYSYDAANLTWVNKGWRATSSDQQVFSSAYVTQTPVVQNSAQQTGADSAYTNGLQTFVWEDSRGGSRYCVIDQVTGQTIVPDTLIHANAIKPKVFATQNTFAILYVNNSDLRLYYAWVIPTSPAAALSPTAITPASTDRRLNTTLPNYDVCQNGATLYIAYNDMAAGGGISTATANTNAAPAWTFSLASLLAEQAKAISVATNLFTSAVMTVYYNGTALKFAEGANTGTIETLNNVVNVSACCSTSIATVIDVFYTVSASQTWNYYTKAAQVVAGYGVLLGKTFRSLGIAGKAFGYNTIGHIVCAYHSPLQPTYFVLNRHALVVAKILYANGGGIPLRTDGFGAAMLPETNVFTSSTTYQSALLQKDFLTASAGQVYTQTGITSVAWNFFDAVNSYQRSTHANTLHVSGGYLQMYDGVSPVEHGFHLFPEPITVNDPASFGGLPNVGGGYTYQYVAVYEWTDNQGQIHRSAPSIAFTYRTGAPISANRSALVTAATLRVTAKMGYRASASIVLYRTENNGTVFYRTTSITSPTLNDTTVDSMDISDTTPDSTLVGNALLYTTGGVVENIAPDACSSMTTYFNRLVLLSSVNPLQLWYSKQVLPGTPVEFSDLFTLNIDPRGGAVTAIATLDDKLISFKANSIGFNSGRGPDSTGGQNDWSDWVLITTDCGCTNPRSIVTTPDGLMFQSAKGIYLLDRSLSVSYIGAAVEAYNSYTVTSAQLIPKTNQVRFTINSGTQPMLVYDYLMRQWSVFSDSPQGIQAVDSCVFQNLHTYLRPNVSVTTIAQQESATATTAPLKVVTGWLSFAGLQGFQRVYKVNVLGDWNNTHDLVVSLAYDFKSSTSQTDTFANINADPNPYQYRIFPNQPRCEAVQVTITDANDSGGAMNLSGLAFEVGIKSGVYKVQASRSAG